MEKQKTPTGQDPLVAAIEEAGTKAFNPASDSNARAEGQRLFGNLISR